MTNGVIQCVLSLWLCCTISTSFYTSSCKFLGHSSHEKGFVLSSRSSRSHLTHRTSACSASWASVWLGFHFFSCLIWSLWHNTVLQQTVVLHQSGLPFIKSCLPSSEIHILVLLPNFSFTWGGGVTVVLVDLSLHGLEGLKRFEQHIFVHWDCTLRH